MTKKKKFGGILDDPLPPLPLGLLMNDSERRKTIATHTVLELQKLKMLTEHYGLEQGNFLGLSLALAGEFIDGFKESKPRGRPRKWEPVILGFLFVDVKREIKNLGSTNKQISIAAGKVAKITYWADFLDKVVSVGISPDPGEAIRKAYYRAKKETWSHIAWGAYCYHRKMGTESDWDERVAAEVQKSAENEKN